MADVTARPVIFISYSHLDEPEKPGDGEVRWLSFVQKFLRPLEKHGVLKTWDDRRTRGGLGWRGEISKQLNACDVCILLVSPNSLSSDFILDDEMKRMLERRKDEGAHIYPIVITPTPFKGAEWLTEMQLRPGKTQPLSSYPLSEREAKMVAIVEEIADILDEMAKCGRRAAKIRLGDEAQITTPDIIDVEKLPLTPYKKLVGRDAELTQLNDAWRDDKTNVVSLTAWGGAGKTALLNEWLARLRDDNYRGAAAVLGWSFYSQGTQERATSAEGFLDWALAKLNAKADSNSSSAKGEKLAEEIGKRRVLMVLDGVEPLQHGPSGQQGQLKDPGLRILLRRFAAIPPAVSHGLIILTSRLEMRDIDQWKRAPDKAGSVLAIDLGHLSDDAGAELLTDNGVKGTPRELRGASHEFEGHALALNLLASFLARRHRGDIQRRNSIGPLLQKSDARGHDHARRVMQAYEAEWLKDEPVLSAILQVIGLFDRPASSGCLASLRRTPPIDGLTDGLVGLTSDQWADAVSTLREVHLLDPEEPTVSDALDAHPLVREWFGERLKQTNEATWKAAHGRLYEHLRDTTKEGKTPNLEDLAPLYQAIAHGCRADRHPETLTDIYKKRICRRLDDEGELEFYSLKMLGAFGSELAAISWFFDKPYETPVSYLTTQDQYWVSNIASVCLRAQGRFGEALPATRAALRGAEDTQEWRNAAIGASNLSEFELLAGDVLAAVAAAEQSVVYADRSGDELQMMSKRTTHGDALHNAGRRDEASRLFMTAEERQRKRQPPYPMLYSTWGYKYCELLLGNGEYTAARDRANQTLEWGKRQYDLLSRALDMLTLDQAQFGLTLEQTILSRPNNRDEGSLARIQFDETIDCLRNAGQVQFVPRGLLARAAFRRSVGDWDGTARDLDEVEEIADASPMRLFLCDMALESARLTFARIEAFAPLNGIKDNPPQPIAPSAEQIVELKREAEKQLKAAADYIEKCGYHRRDEELAELQAVLRGEKKFADLPPRV